MRLGNRRASTVAWAVVFFTILILCVVALLCGCDGNAVMYYDSDVNKLDVGQRFVTDDEDSRFSTVVDTQTGITYLIWDSQDGNSSVGGITVLLNRDGTPVMAEENHEGANDD